MDLRNFLKREVKRRIHLVELLYYTDSPLSADYLTNALGCSLPALHNTVYALNNEDLPLNIFKNQGGYTLQFYSYASIDSLYAEMIKGTLDFQILKRLFFQLLDNIPKNASYLNCSYSTYSSKLRQIKRFLLQWEIDLAHRPLKVLGDEDLLRHFYYLFFKEQRLAFHEYDFSDKLVRLIDRYIRELLAANHAKNTMNTHFYLLHNFLICLYRRRKGHKLDISLVDPTSLRLPKKSEHSELARRIRWECHLTFDEELIFEALWPLLSGTLVLTAQQQAVQQCTNKRLARFYAQHIKLLKEINQTIGNTLTEEEMQAALRHLGNELFIYYPEKKPINILSQQKKYSLLRLKKIYVRPINQLTRMIERFLKRHRLPAFEETLETYLCSLIVSIDNLLNRLSIQAEPLNVLLLSDASPHHETFWQNVLKRWIDGPLNCHFHSDPYITQRELAHLTKKYDLLITDVTMPELKSHCAVITINSYPTTKDFAMIQHFIDRYDPHMHKRKEKPYEPTLPA